MLRKYRYTNIGILSLHLYDDYVVLRRKGMLRCPPPPSFMVVLVVLLFSVWFFPIYIFLVRRICSTPYTTRLSHTASATISRLVLALLKNTSPPIDSLVLQAISNSRIAQTQLAILHSITCLDTNHTILSKLYWTQFL